MNHLNLLAPETYNIVSEMKNMLQIKINKQLFENGVEEPISVTYSELIKTLIK